MADMHSTRVLIVDDHAMTRRGVRAFLSTDPLIQVVGEAENGPDAVRQARGLEPDVVLTDLRMPGGGGMEAVAEIKRLLPHVKIIILTMLEGEVNVRTAIRAGADGYLLKDADGEKLLYAIHAVQRGDVPIDPRLIQHLREDAAGYEDPRAYTPLTAREKEVLRLAATGLSTRDLAQALDVSTNTVKAHMSSIFAKLNVTGRTEAVFLAMQLDLVPADADDRPRNGEGLIVLKNVSNGS